MNENQQQQQQTQTQAQAQAQAQRAPLRRAVYVHVSDLTSAYNIDHKKLEQELTRVKRDTPSSPSTESTQPTDDGSQTSVPQKRLQPPRGGFNLCVLVGGVNVVVDKLRVDRSRVRLAEVEVGDETGTVSLRARDDQIDVLEAVSKRKGAVVLRNCTLELFQGRHIRLAVTKWGKLSTYPDNVASTPPQPSKMNDERNFSLIDLSLVASEMVENQPPEGSYLPNRERETTTSARGSGLQQRSLPSMSNVPYHQPVRRQPRNQRPGRTRGGNPLPVPYTDTNIPHHLRYPGVGTYGHGYADSVELQHFSLAYSQQQAERMRQSQQSSLQPSSQHLLQLQQYEQMQQYEMQQRQIQQIHAYQGQQERQRTLYRQLHQSQVLVPSPLPPNNFDVTGADFPSLPGASPVINPAAVSSFPEPRGPLTQAPPRERSGETERSFVEPSPSPSPLPLGPNPAQVPLMGSPDVRPQPSSGQSHSEGSIRTGAWAAGRPNITSTPSDVAVSPGRMNPRAMSFAPSYGKAHQGAVQHAHTQYAAYIPYDPSHGGSIYPGSAQHHVYPRNLMYLPFQPEGPSRYSEQHQHQQTAPPPAVQTPAGGTAERIESDDKQGSSKQ